MSSEALCEGGHSIVLYYVYIIQSEKDASYYAGVTTDLKQRIAAHNSGSPRYSSTKRPFKLKWYCAFSNKEKAYQFERYLKAGSGMAFRNKHLI